MYYLTKGRGVYCRHVDGKKTGYVYADTEKGKIDLPFEWDPITFETREAALLEVNRQPHGARVLSEDALLGGASYCGHTRDLFAGV